VEEPALGVLSKLLLLLLLLLLVDRAAGRILISGRFFRQEMKCNKDVGIRLDEAFIVYYVSAAFVIDHLIAVGIVAVQINAANSLIQVHLQPVIRPRTEPVCTMSQPTHIAGADHAGFRKRVRRGSEGRKFPVGSTGRAPVRCLGTKSP